MKVVTAGGETGSQVAWTLHHPRNVSVIDGGADGAQIPKKQRQVL